MTLKTLREDFPLKNRDGLVRRLINALTVISWVLCSSLLDVPMWITILVLFPIWFFTSWITRRLCSDWAKEKDFRGEIQLFDNYISTGNGLETSIQEIDSIEIISNYYRGFAQNNRDVTHNGLTQLRVKSSIESYDVKFLISNKEEFQQFLSILRFWYGQDVLIKEYFTEQKLHCFLLDPTMTYKELQLQKIKKVPNKELS